MVSLREAGVSYYSKLAYSKLLALKPSHSLSFFTRSSCVVMLTVVVNANLFVPMCNMLWAFKLLSVSSWHDMLYTPGLPYGCFSSIFMKAILTGGNIISF